MQQARPPRPSARRIWLILLTGLVVGLVSAVVLLVVGAGSYRVRILSPRESALVTQRFVVDVAVAGDSRPERLEVLVDGQVVGSESVPTAVWREPGSALVTAISADVGSATPGWHELQVRLDEDAASVTQRLWVVDTSRARGASDAEVGALRRAFGELLPDAVVALSRARRQHPERWPLDEEYLLARDRVTEALEPAEVQERVAELFRVIESDPAKLVHLAGDRLDAALLRHGYPLWLTVFETRYLDDRPPRTLLLTYELKEPLTFRVDGETIDALVATRLDNLNVRELMLGHRSTGVPQAVLLADRIGVTAASLGECVASSADQCAAAWAEDGTYEHFPASLRRAMAAGIAAEVRGVAGDCATADACSQRVERLLVRSVAHHEVRHVFDHRRGIPIARSLQAKLERAREDAAVIDTDTLLGRIELEEASYRTVRGANAELSAYLAQLAEADGLRRYTLFKQLVFATLAYHDGTDEAWASRAILAGLGGRVAAGTAADLHRDHDNPRWFELGAALVAVSPERLAEAARALYAWELGRYIPAAAVGR